MTSEMEFTLSGDDAVDIQLTPDGSSLVIMRIEIEPYYQVCPIRGGDVVEMDVTVTVIPLDGA